MPAKTYVMTVREAIEQAYMTLNQLRSSIADVTDRGDARLNGMARTRILRQTLERLSTVKFQLPDTLSSIGDSKIEFVQYHRPGKRGARRRDLRDNVSYVLRSVYELVHESAIGEWSVYADRLEECIATLESLVFPNQYGKT